MWVPKAAEIAREAGARLREFFAQGVETEYKGDVDLVTVADRDGGEADPRAARRGLSRARHLRRRGHARPAWKASSAGTWIRWMGPRTLPTDFRNSAFRWAWSSGRPGLKPDEDGTLVAAVIYDPMRDELFTAERGQGAWLNGKPMHVSRTPDLAESLVATGFPSRKRHDSPNIHFYQEFTLRSHGVRRAGSAALDLAYVACGRWMLSGSSI